MSFVIKFVIKHLRARIFTKQQIKAFNKPPISIEQPKKAEEMSGGGPGPYLAYLTFEPGLDEGDGSRSESSEDEAEEDAGTIANCVVALQRYGTSDNVSERQLAVRQLVKTLQTVESDGAAVDTVLALVSDGFAVDSDPLIRAELLEQLPMLCMFCSQSERLGERINDALVPLLVQFLNDQNIQVRKTCQAAIQILLEQELLGMEVLEKTIIPVLLHQSSSDVCADETRVETVTLLCKIVTTALDRHQAVRLFLEKFTALCQEPRLFHIRKQCASSLGEMSRMLGAELTERVLVPHLINLTQDSVWGVRKACAENYTQVSNNCCMATRRNLLAPSFMSLLTDASRWVQSSAFQALGPFISTFADSNRTGLKWIDGSLTYDETSIENDKCNAAESGEGVEQRTELPAGVLLPVNWPLATSPSDNNEQPGALDYLLDELAIGALKCESDSEEEGGDSLESDQNYNSFLYWHPPAQPLSEAVPDILPSPVETPNDLHSYIERRMGKPLEEEVRKMQLFDPNAADDDSSSDDDSSPITFSPSSKHRDEMGDGDIGGFDYQDIIPQALLDNFLSMVEPSRAQTVESDISRHCAYNLPAVAFTIGRQHWNLLRPTYAALANDMQWKVRRTLAFSIHELAAILGEERSVQDLVPVFSGFMRDLDEVRVGILKHLHEFLKLLPVVVRKQQLQHVSEFLQTDNVRNWRFRLMLAEQLGDLCGLFQAVDINEYLSPIAMTLATDRVAEIRRMAYRVLATILQHFFRSEAKQSSSALTDHLITDIIRSFALSQRYVRRQSFAYICADILELEAIPKWKFAERFFPRMLLLAQDSIPNVRIAFLRCMDAEMLGDEQMEKLVKKLASEDKDRDVRLLSSRLLSPSPSPANPD